LWSFANVRVRLNHNKTAPSRAQSTTAVQNAQLQATRAEHGLEIKSKPGHRGPGSICFSKAASFAQLFANDVHNALGESCFGLTKGLLDPNIIHAFSAADSAWVFLAFVVEIDYLKTDKALI
jgi:hypothetical protein